MATNILNGIKSGGIKLPAVHPKVKKAAGLSAAGAACCALLIAHWEGKDLTAKHNSFDPPRVVTVCNGVTNYDWPWLKAGMKFTNEQCATALAENVQKYAAPIAKCVPSFTSMPPHRQAALTSFAYNLGPARICNSSIARDLNAGRVTRACNAMLQYTRAAGKQLTGLVRRRQQEHEWCLRND